MCCFVGNQSVAKRTNTTRKASIMNPLVRNRQHSETVKLRTDGPARTITLFDGDPADKVLPAPTAPGAITPLLHDDNASSPWLANAAAQAVAEDDGDCCNGCGCDVDGGIIVAMPLRSKTAAKGVGSRSAPTELRTADTTLAHSARVDLLFCANTEAVTDSMAAATLRGVTMICGRTAVAPDVLLLLLHDAGIPCCGWLNWLDACDVLATTVCCCVSESQSSLELSKSILKLRASSAVGIVLESSLTKDKSCGTSGRESY